MSDSHPGPVAPAAAAEAVAAMLGLFARNRQARARRRRLATAVISVAGHVAVFFALVVPRGEPLGRADPQPISVNLVQPPTIEPAPVLAPAEPSPAPPPPRTDMFRRTPQPPPEVEPLAAGDDETTQAGVEVSDSELAGAATAGSGSGTGGACNMPQRLQNALRKDRLALGALAQAHRGQAIRVWGGDWVRHPGQDGAGLAAVREAIMWEVGFAPAACRAERVNGLVVISLADGPGAARIVLGSGQWRWSDLLFARQAPAASP